MKMSDLKRHLPSRQEGLEILALALMVAGLQWLVKSWGWSAFFALGFIWNWAVLNGWVQERVEEREYRFSVLKGVVRLNAALLRPLQKWPHVVRFAQVVPAGLIAGFFVWAFQSSVPWEATFLGSFAFFLVRTYSLFPKSRLLP